MSQNIMFYFMKSMRCGDKMLVLSSYLPSFLFQRKVQQVDDQCNQCDEHGGDDDLRQRDIAQQALLGITGELLERHEDHEHRE